jgi:plastocyanin
MHRIRRSHARPRVVALLVVAAASALALWTLTRTTSSRAESGASAAAPAAAHAAHGDAHDHAKHEMSAAQMKAWVDQWYAVHPRRGTHSGDTPVDTFTVFDFGYSNDATIGDEDTAQIFVGQTILWRWVNGLGHTVTNGTGFLDPDAGMLFDQPSNSANREFAFEFTTPGLVPFFCRPHEGIMAGAVNVAMPTDVVPISDRHALVGFAVDPSPNPTRDLATFRFALARGGRARVEVFDVRGRRVAVPVDRDLTPGTYAAVWDGRTQQGERVTAGVYFLRLAVPGKTESREVVVAR